MIARGSSIIPITPAATHVGKEGYAVTTNGTTAAVVSSNAASAFGVITEGAPITGKSAVAPFGSGKVVKVKLDGTSGSPVLGDKLKITTTGTFQKTTSSDVGAIVGAVALEAGGNSELIEAMLLPIDRIELDET